MKPLLEFFKIFFLTVIPEKESPREDEKQGNAEADRHMMMKEAAELAKKAGVPEMWLTHYSPSMIHPERYIKELQKIFPGTVAGKDGMFRELRFEEDE